VVNKQKKQSTHESTELNIDDLLSDGLQVNKQGSHVESAPQEEPILDTITVEPKLVKIPNLTKVDHKSKATETIKKIVRLFRKFIKDSDQYNRKDIE
jgi:hypothetical protein